nr:hypothetical transcript [Hymenolepis microstoma]
MISGQMKRHLIDFQTIQLKSAARNAIVNSFHLTDHINLAPKGSFIIEVPGQVNHISLTFDDGGNTNINSVRNAIVNSFHPTDHINLAPKGSLTIEIPGQVNHISLTFDKGGNTNINSKKILAPSKCKGEPSTNYSTILHISSQTSNSEICPSFSLIDGANDLSESASGHSSIKAIPTNQENTPEDGIAVPLSSKPDLPQGAVTSYFLFNVFNNDIANVVQTVNGVKCSLYADDLVLWYSAPKKNAQKRTEIAPNHALKLLPNWCENNGMVINTSKLHTKHFHRRTTA